MKIRFIQSCSTDGPAYSAGNTYDVAKATAQGFIGAGLAVPAGEPGDVETAASIDEDVEIAATPRKKNGKK